MKQYRVIGIMSGTSLDGVDLCYAEFYSEAGGWKYRNVAAQTFRYSDEWKSRLMNLNSQGAETLARTHVEYGHYLGQLVNDFCSDRNLVVDLISSHGHTIFHQPENHFTTQIGDGASIYAITGVRTVSDLRNVDVALGGQGAPLVPIGERDLFDGFGMFLNLGGIANVSIFSAENQPAAFDISPCNMSLNMLCEKYLGTAYDEGGLRASMGEINPSLLDSVSALEYFKATAPKSLGKEFTDRLYLPIIERYDISIEDKLHTITQHIANEICRAINHNAPYCRQGRVLVSGGGAYNTFLMELLNQQCELELVVPEEFIVEFKEALIFAYLGLLRTTGAANSLASVTFARKDNIGGTLWG